MMGRDTLTEYGALEKTFEGGETAAAAAAAAVEGEEGLERGNEVNAQARPALLADDVALTASSLCEDDDLLTFPFMPQLRTELYCEQLFIRWCVRRSRILYARVPIRSQHQSIVSFLDQRTY